MKNKTLSIFLAAGLSILFLSACSSGGGGNDDLLTELTAETETACADGLDDDDDGTTDCADSDCALDSACATAPTTETACADGLDDDGDGLVDCADSDCALDTTNCPETVEAKAEVCTGGLDEDGDGLVDCDDTVDCAADTVACPPAALEVAIEVCTGGVDDDDDGLVDCEDGDCAESLDCEEEREVVSRDPNETKELMNLDEANKVGYLTSPENVEAGPGTLSQPAMEPVNKRETNEIKKSFIPALTGFGWQLDGDTQKMHRLKFGITNIDSKAGTFDVKHAVNAKSGQYDYDVWYQGVRSSVLGVSEVMHAEGEYTDPRQSHSQEEISVTVPTDWNYDYIVIVLLGFDLEFPESGTDEWDKISEVWIQLAWSEDDSLISCGILTKDESRKGYHNQNYYDYVNYVEDYADINKAYADIHFDQGKSLDRTSFTWGIDYILVGFNAATTAYSLTNLVNSTTLEEGEFEGSFNWGVYDGPAVSEEDKVIVLLTGFGYFNRSALDVYDVSFHFEGAGVTNNKLAEKVYMRAKTKSGEYKDDTYGYGLSMYHEAVLLGVKPENTITEYGQVYGNNETKVTGSDPVRCMISTGVNFLDSHLSCYNNEP